MNYQASGEVAAFHTSDAGLYNDAKDGSLLVLWHLTTAATPQPGIPIYPPIMFGYFTDGKGANPPAAGLPLVSAEATIAGLVWQETDRGSLGLEQYVFPLVGGGYEWPHEWPIATIYPGKSFAVYVTSPYTDVEGCFVWEQVPQL